MTNPENFDKHFETEIDGTFLIHFWRVELRKQGRRVVKEPRVGVSVLRRGPESGVGRLHDVLIVVQRIQLT